ncbi:response regulator [Herbiconiux sp. P15]|uniref:response regulator transcription factor n=1 Tax=Herbiconiux liukaitaii TaxID=3342799 RepID=UPI0035BAF9C2
MIVDDQVMIRAGLRAILDSQTDIEVVADTGDGIEAVRIAAETSLDVVLMDIRMPGIDGVEATRRLRAGHTAEQLRIVVLTTFESDENVIAALRAGANGFLGKAVGPTELAEAIRDVSLGGGALSAAATAALIGHVVEERRPEIDVGLVDRFSSLTPREHDVVIAIATGLDNTQIAAQMFVSPFTVKTHANRAMMKLGARDRAQLVTFAYRAGLG